MTDIKQALIEIKRGSLEIIQEDDLAKRIEEKGQLTVKAGFDPTVSDLHLGHTVLINKMRTFQELGHRVVFLIGDFTAMIGDPSGRDITRPPLTHDQVKANAKTYADQVFKILDPERTEVRYNSEWMSNKSSVDMIKLASHYNVARMLERDDFNKRYKEGRSIAIHEFLYPLVQGYDSVALQSDIELGGGDQKFNLLVGRELQRHYGQKPQNILTVPLLEGTDGVYKMSKSRDNYIGITEAPEEMFGKLMSISDDMMWRYYELLSFRPQSEIEKIQSQVKEGLNPRDVKMWLANEIIARFHGEVAAKQAEESFINRFRHGNVAENIEAFEVKSDNGQIQIGYALKECALVSSTSEAMRMIKQGAVKVDQVKVSDKSLVLDAGSEYLLQVGKRRIAKCLVV